MRLRGTGCLYRPKYRARDGSVKTARIWHWKGPRGYRRTTGCRDKRDAQRWALARLAEMHGSPEAVRCHYDDLEHYLLDDWAAKGRRSLPQAHARLRHLRRHFSGWDATAITTDRITAYALERRRQGAAAGTINLELALLRRAFVLARRAGRVRDVPIVDRLPKAPPRTGTVEPGDLEAILAVLPARYVPVVQFLYCTGWREREALTLTWDCVDDHEVHLEASRSKTGRGRSYPYRASATLAAVLEAQRTARRFSPWVFPGRGGRPMDRTALQKAWRRACVAVGVPTALLHDLRRTAARDLRRAGVAPYVAMSQLGHQDPSTHRDYSVVLPVDLAEAVRRLEALRASLPRRRSLTRL